MKCLKPLTIVNKKVYRDVDHIYNLSNPSDRRAYEMRYGREAYLSVPCGKCEACIERKSNDWAVRLYYEWLYSKTSKFLTLTIADHFLKYSDVCISYGSYREYHRLPTLDKRSVQLFMKRLRKKLGNGLRFFLGGEYGEESGRPHYHLMLIDYDKKYEDTLIDIVESCWSYGNVNQGETNIQRCMYVAKYIYSTSNFDFNLITGLQKPFTLQSRRPGLGYKYFQDKYNVEYHNRTLDKGIPIDENKYMGMPRFYRDKIFTEENKEKLYTQWINEEQSSPTQDEINIFLKRFNKKKRGKAI